MNREILFRGQTRKKGEKVKNFRGDPMPSEWVYGRMLSQNNGGDFSIIYTYEPIDTRVVYTDTVGEYTGLTDKNGTKIFEGDILKLVDKNQNYEWLAVVEFGNPNATYSWGWQLRPITKQVRMNTDILLWVETEITGATAEIIGNIHDNPDLLEVE